MKVAMVSLHANPLAPLGEAGNGGINVHVAELARAMGAAGHEVNVFTRRDSPGQPKKVGFGPNAYVAHLDAESGRQLLGGPAHRRRDLDLERRELPLHVVARAGALRHRLGQRHGSARVGVHEQELLLDAHGPRLGHAGPIPTRPRVQPSCCRTFGGRRPTSSFRRVVPGNLGGVRLRRSDPSSSGWRRRARGRARRGPLGPARAGRVLPGVPRDGGGARAHPGHGRPQRWRRRRHAS